MQRKFILRTVAILGILWLVVHFALTLIYSVRELKVPDMVRQVSDEYTIPLFHQNWKLFAPDVPEYDVQLFFSTSDSGIWSEFHDVSEFHGFGRHSNMETVEQSICGGLGWQVANNLYTTDLEMKFDRIVESGQYNKAVYFVEKMHDTGDLDMPDSLQLQLRFRFTPDPHGAFNYQYSQLSFPKQIWRSIP